MPQTVEVPGLGVVEFPDDMTPDAIAGVLRKRVTAPTPPQYFPETPAGPVLGPPEPPQYEPETVEPVLPPPRVEAPSPMGGMPLVFIPPAAVTPEQATARSMAAPSTLLPSFPEKYGAGVAQGFPFVEELGPKVRETDPAWLAAAKALVNVGLSIPEFATSPLGALTQAAGPIAPRVTSAAFSIDMLGGALKQFPEVYAKWNTLSPARKIETGINLAAAIVMGGFLGRKAVTGYGKQPLGRPNITQRQAVQFTTELAEKDPAKFGELAAEQVQKAVDVDQRQPTVPVVPVVPAPPEKEPAPTPPAEKALTAPAAGETVKGVTTEAYEKGAQEPAPVEGVPTGGTLKRIRPQQYEFEYGGQVFEIHEVSKSEGVSQKPVWNVRIKGTQEWFDSGNTLKEAQHWARVAAQQPAAPAAQAKETYAPEERKVEEGVQPERVGTDAQRLPAEAGPSDSVRAAAEGPKAPEGTLPLTPPAAEAGKPAAAKEPWQMTKVEWQAASKAASDAELKALRSLAGSPRQKEFEWGTAERLRLQYGVEAAPIRPRGVPVVTHERVVQKALSEGKPVPPEVLADYPDLKPTAPSTKAGEAPAMLPEGVPSPAAELNLRNASVRLTKAGLNYIIGEPRDAPMFKSMAKGKLKIVQQYWRALDELEASKKRTPTPGAAAGGPISPGPGAAAAGTPGTGSAIRELADYIAALPPLPAPRKLSLAEKWAERLGAGKDLGTRLALKTTAITQSIKETMRGVRRPTELGDKVAQLDFLLQHSAGESLRARRVLEHAIRNEDVRSALWLYADARGDLAAIRDTLTTMPADTKPAVRRALQLALNLPVEARNWLPFIEQFYGRKFAEAEAEGVLHEALPDYFTHVWKVKEDMPGSVQAALNSGKISEYFRFARERKLSTMLEGIKNPTMIPGMRLEPVLDAAKIMSHYNYALDRAIASRKFMEHLTEMNASDGRPMVAPTGTVIPSEELKWAVINDTTGRADPFVKGIFDTEAEANAELARRGAGYHVEQRKNEFLIIKSRVRPEEIAKYRPIDHPAMRKWQWAGTDATGKTTLYEGELLAHPEAYERLARFMDRSRLTPSTVTRAALRYSGEVKAAKLGLLSTFHQVHVAKHAIFHWTNPFRAPEIEWDSPEVRFAIEKGHLKLAPEPGELNNFAEGILADEAIIHKLPIVGELSRRYSHYVFTDYIPRLKMATFANALERNRAIYGPTRGIAGVIKAFGAKPLSDAEIAARVGDSVNAAFGELNKLWLGKQGRDPRFQRALRMIFLAPDFGEARLRFVGKGFTKYGAEERFALAMNFATIYGLARLGNWLATGDPHSDDPKHWFDVKLGDHWYSMRSVMTDIAHLLAKPERFARVRLNPGITEPLLEFMSSRNWLGQTRTKWQQVEDYAKKFIPIAAQSLAEDDRHLWESFLGSMGIQPKRGDAVSEIHERAAQFRKDHGIQETVEVQQAPTGNPYREGRIALEFDDEPRFWKAMQAQYAQLKARNNPDPIGTIQSAFDRYYSRPFMGNQRLEKDFVAQMGARDRKLYAEARKEQQVAAKKFHAWWSRRGQYLLGQPAPTARPAMPAGMPLPAPVPLSPMFQP